MSLLRRTVPRERGWALGGVAGCLGGGGGSASDLADYETIGVDGRLR